MINLKVSPEQAILRLQEKVNEIAWMRAQRQVLEFYDFVGWCSKTWGLIDELYRADDMHPEDIRVLGTPSCSCGSAEDAQQALLELYQTRLLAYIDEIAGSMKNPA